MGNTNNSNNGQFALQIDKPFYMAGENVTGSIFFNLNKPFKSETLYISLKGQECVYLEEKRTKAEQNGDQVEEVVYYEPFFEKNIFLRTEVPLSSWPGYNTMPTGQFTFPFTFSLQAQLPGSFCEENEGDTQPAYKATVKYKVKAYLLGANGEKLKASQPLVIREPLKQVVEGQFKESIVKPNTWCCIGQGESHMKCYFEKNIYTPGETARLKAEIDNSNCNLAIKDLTCYLIKSLHMTALKHQFKKVENLQTIVCQGVNAHEKACGLQSRICEIPICKPNLKPSQPGTNGKLVQCNYSLRVVANLDGCLCCSNKPDVIVPISVVCLPSANFQLIQAPQNWNPQVFPVANVAVNYGQYQQPMPPPQMPPINIPMQQQMQQQYPNNGGVVQFSNQLDQQIYPNHPVQPYFNQQDLPNNPLKEQPYNQQQIASQNQFAQPHLDIPKPYVDKPPEAGNRIKMELPSFDQLYAKQQGQSNQPLSSNDIILQNYPNQPNYMNNNLPQNQQNYGGPSGNQYPQQGYQFQNPAIEQQGLAGNQGQQHT